MVKEIIDIGLINEFLNIYNNTKVNDIRNPFLKYDFLYIDDIPVGFISYSLLYDRIELEHIFILEDKRRRGYASKLLDYLIKLAKRKNLINITLEVNVNNQSAINLYKKHAFEVVAIREKYYGNNDGYLMIRMM